MDVMVDLHNYLNTIRPLIQFTTKLEEGGVYPFWMSGSQEIGMKI